MSATLARSLPATGLAGRGAKPGPALGALVAGAVGVAFVIVVSGNGLTAGGWWAIVAGGLACSCGMVLGTTRRPPVAVALGAGAMAALAVAALGGPSERADVSLPSAAVAPRAEAADDRTRGVAPAAGGNETGGAPAIRARSAARAVREFYAALDGGRFAQAWARLSAGVQASFGGFEAWRAGYATTLGHDVEDLRMASTAAGSIVEHVLVARDRTPCGTQTERRFAVRWTLGTPDADTPRATALSAVKLAGQDPAQACG